MATDRTFIISPPSTAHPSRTGRWWHREGCPIESDGSCTCGQNTDTAAALDRSHNHGERST